MADHQITQSEYIGNRVRACIQHYCDKLSISHQTFADGIHVSPDRLRSFMNGSGWLSNAEFASLGEIVPELQAAEDRDAYDLIRKGWNPPKTLRDVMNGT